MSGFCTNAEKQCVFASLHAPRHAGQTACQGAGATATTTPRMVCPAMLAALASCDTRCSAACLLLGFRVISCCRCAVCWVSLLKAASGSFPSCQEVACFRQLRFVCCGACLRRNTWANMSVFSMSSCSRSGRLVCAGVLSCVCRDAFRVIILCVFVWNSHVNAL